MNQHVEFTGAAHLLYTRLKQRANRWCMNLLPNSFFLLCNIFSQFFLLPVWMRTRLSQADRLHSATFSLRQKAKNQSQTIRSSFGKKKSFPWIVEGKIRAKMQMSFLARRTQFGSCVPKLPRYRSYIFLPLLLLPPSPSYQRALFCFTKKHDSILTVKHKSHCLKSTLFHRRGVNYDLKD